MYGKVVCLLAGSPGEALCRAETTVPLRRAIQHLVRLRIGNDDGHRLRHEGGDQMRRHGQAWLVLITTAAFYGITAACVAGHLDVNSSVTLAMGLSFLVWFALAGVLLGPEAKPTPSWRSRARR
jgi:hypothetical protein